MAKKKEFKEETEFVNEETLTVENVDVILETEKEEILLQVEDEVKPVVKETKSSVKEVTAELPIQPQQEQEFTVDQPVITPKNIVEDIQLKTEFEVGDSVKIDDKPYKVVKVKITKSYDLEDQFGRVERNVYAHLVKDNSVNIAAFVAKSNEL